MNQGQRYRVLDKVMLGEVVKWVVEKAGGQKQAAVKLKLAQSQISKLRRGLVRGVGEHTFRQLAKVCSPELRRKLKTAVLGDKGLRVVRAYQAWLAQQLPEYGMSSNQPIVEALDKPDQAGLMGLVFTASTEKTHRAPWPTRVTSLVAALEASKQYGGYFNDFDEKIRKRWGSSPDVSLRIKLSQCRVVSPLVSHIMPGGHVPGTIERTIDELDASKELTTYLQAAFRAEAILLNRAPYLARAQDPAETNTPGTNRLEGTKLFTDDIGAPRSL